jgi:hypothetical protein
MFHWLWNLRIIHYNERERIREVPDILTFQVPDVLTFQVLDFKPSSCSEHCILSFGSFPGFWILYADVSEQSVPKRLHIKFRPREITLSTEQVNNISGTARVFVWIGGKQKRTTTTPYSRSPCRDFPKWISVLPTLYNYHEISLSI